MSDWSSDVCSSDLGDAAQARLDQMIGGHLRQAVGRLPLGIGWAEACVAGDDVAGFDKAVVIRIACGHAVFRHADEGVNVKLVIGEDQDRKSTRLNSSH